MSHEANPITRILQWNVFEDGLADTPAALSFDDDFRSEFEALLVALGGQEPLYGFESRRDFTVLPSAVPLTTIEAFFGGIDCVYNLLYHSLGGEAQLEGSGATVPLGNSLRALFLSTRLDGSAWVCPDFEPSLAKATASCASATAAAAAVRAVRDSAFDASTGSLAWSRSTAQRIRKRGTIALAKWMGLSAAGEQLVRGLHLFLQPPAEALADVNTAAALQTFLHVAARESHEVKHDVPSTFSASTEPHAPLEALVEVELGTGGALIRLRTFTLHAAVRWLLRRLIVRALARGDYKAGGGDSAAAAVQRAVATFCGSEVWADADAERMTGCVFARVSAAMHSWTEASALPNRHRIFSRRVAAASPDVLTLVEYCDAWRREPLPTAPGREYRAILGSGTAAILFDVRRYEEVELAMKGVDADRHIMNSSLGMGRVVRSMRERGDAISVVEGGGMNPIDESAVAPKSSCVALLRRRVDGMLFLVAACHFESGKPSDTAKVVLRAAAMRTTLRELELRVEHIRRSLSPPLGGSGGDVAIVLAGDLNAIREEFVFGNTDAFFSSAGAASVRPALRQPRPGTARAPAPHPPLGELTLAGGLCGGGLILRCDGCDGAALAEASCPQPHSEQRPASGIGGGGGCTRAGASMVIDYIFVGSARPFVVGAGERESVAGDGGRAATGGGTGPAATSAGSMCNKLAYAFPVVPAEDTARAAHEALGLRHAIMHWGSDHLPVACEICIAPSALSAKAQLWDGYRYATIAVGVALLTVAATAILRARRH